MMPDPFHVVVDDIQYKIDVSYGEYENMVSGKFGAKKRAFQHICSRICEFRGKNKPNFQVLKKESLLLVQANAQGFQDTQMSQDSLLITQDNYDQSVKVTQQPFVNPLQPVYTRSILKRGLQGEDTCTLTKPKQMRASSSRQMCIFLQAKRSTPIATYMPAAAQKQNQNRIIQQKATPQQQFV